MRHINELEKILSNLFNWHKARISCLVQIVQALFYVKTVNLIQIANAFQRDVKEDSSYRRIQRFFKNFSFDTCCIVTLILRLFTQEKFILIMDKTNWKWGKKHISILMLSVAYKGIAIPIFWTVNNKAGNSSLDDRCTLLKKVINKIGIKRIEVLLADREFIGEKWFRYLIQHKIPFLVRIKKNYKVCGIEIGIQVALENLLKKWILKTSLSIIQ